ncbi:tRNA (adenosine(37)-N6)-threonylcarbamoyltransferase complex dimerization subunit type 1 TsaB [Betaproteobacteria bacterium]|nr:tRNA (adenosine(37)-N6)-threonylcarbamoyltransferase complex dimerization subunit type 1 TsaB [Betaproteobacteria bacterium]GHU47272.1 tRNA (adenosine(37)-N6)-threonylcarbamoyltransferase complex dimerization subunit type 1 TsaB [Betaproteobacteria bacterium]
MQILALETSTESGSCALWQDGCVLAADCPAGASHSATLIPLAQQLLASVGSDFSTLDAIAFGMGPGAFTGLRVACGIAQGMAVALDKPVLPVGSLECMAWAAGGEKVLSLLDARMGEVYVGAFTRHAGGVQVVGELQVLRPEDIELPTDFQLVGNALLAYPQLLERISPHAKKLPGILPHARPLVELAALAFARGEGLDPSLALPRYVRDKVARTTAERLADGVRT